MRRDKIVLSLENIHLNFKGLKIFENLNAVFSSGKVNVIIGENGSGKTTLFNLISGIIKPEKGKILLNSKDITKLSFKERAKRGIVRSFQEPRVFKFLTVCENVLFSFRHLPFDRLIFSIFKNLKNERRKVEELLEEFELSDKSSLKAGELSLGNQRLLNLITALNSKGMVFLLDEPLAGINEVFHNRIIDRIKLLAKDNLVLVIEHSEETIEALEGRVYRLESGKILSV